MKPLPPRALADLDRDRARVRDLIDKDEHGPLFSLLLDNEWVRKLVLVVANDIAHHDRPVLAATAWAFLRETND